MRLRGSGGSQRGELTIGGLIGLLALAALVYLGYKFIPPYVTYYKVKAIFNSETERKTLQEMRFNIEYKLSEMPNSPIKGKDVQIKRDRKTGALTISAEYAVDVKFPRGYTKTLVFKPKVSSEQGDGG